MAVTNIFMNSYEQPENKLTYNFLCFLEHLTNSDEIIEFLLDSNFGFNENPIQQVDLVYGGGDSNPDGCLELLDKNDMQLTLYLENKTFRRSLDLVQIERHLENYCKKENELLLVVTTRPSDYNLIKSHFNLGKKLYFKTWEQIASKLKTLGSNNQKNFFLINQFLEYGKISGEFESMEITPSELSEYSKHITYIANTGKLFDVKMLNIFDQVLSSIHFHDYNINLKSYRRKNHWGRLGCEVYFSPKNNFGQWMFLGIYYDPSDHCIPFMNNEIELSFFFDIDPEQKHALLGDQEFINEFKQLTKLGYEENLIRTSTTNDWRLLYKRIPISKVTNFDKDYVRNYFTSILHELTSCEVFANKMF